MHTPLDERGRFVDRPTQLDPARPGRWLDEDEIPWFHDPEGLIQREQDPEKRLLLAADTVGLLGPSVSPRSTAVVMS